MNKQETSPTTTTITSFEESSLPKKIRLAINGFGRIGRSVLRISLQNKNVEVIAINDLSDIKTLAHLLKYDSIRGSFLESVSVEDNYLAINGKRILVTAVKEAEKLPWKKLNIDCVIECTGRFTTAELAKSHVVAGAKKVIISAPAKDSYTKTVILGVNEDTIKNEIIISNGSCTTNCIAPVIKALHHTHGVESLVATTIHSVTAEQNLVDSAPPALHTDLRRARSALNNIIPTTSGASGAIVAVFPELKGRVEVSSLRIPVNCGSVTDFVFTLTESGGIEEINQVLRLAATDPKYKGVLAVTEDPIVSSDIIGNLHSTVLDLLQTKVVSKNIVRLLSWYDNEWGYSNRLVELSEMFSLS
jgi:glyceraldehyde 3-phosphate dehydrogenase